MTREEAIHFAKCLKNNWTIDFNDMADFCDMAIKAILAYRPTDSDLISRAYALKALDKLCEEFEAEIADAKDNPEKYTDNFVVGMEEQVVGIAHAYHELYDLPSSEVEPKVIRSKTLMPTKDFKEWAKRVREENPNAVIIPCDAEVPSAEADRPTGEWIVREYCTNELDYRRWIEIECPFCGEIPTYENLDNMKYCPNCGAKMKGENDENNNGAR